MILAGAFKYFLYILAVSVLTACASVQEQPVRSDKTYSFSTDYFTHNISQWEKYLAEMKNKKNIKYLELGVYEGRSLIWTLENILTDPTSEAVAVDIFPGKMQQVFEQNLKVFGHEKKVKIVKGFFSAALKHFSPNTFDLIYLDGGHMSWTTLETTMLAWPLLKNNGIIIFDDYNWNVEKWPIQNTPKPAIDSFLQTHKYFIEVIHVSNQVFIKKVATACEIRGNYACTPLNEWAYYWDKKLLFNVQKKQDIQLNEKNSKELETILNSNSYKLANDVTELSRAAAADKKLILFLSNVENLQE